MTNYIPAELLTSSGVYIIRNSINAKVYVGSAVNFKRRHNSHLNGLKKGVHHSQLLQRFANKYGIATLRFELLATCPAEALLAVEQTFIVMYRAAERDHGFNICKVAGSSLGTKRSGPPHPNTLAAQRAAHLGAKRSPETCELIRRKALGRIVSVETRAKMRESHTMRPAKSAEARARLSQSVKNMSDEKRANITAGLRTPEARAKASASSKGRKQTPETIAKRIAAAQATKNAKKLAVWYC